MQRPSCLFIALALISVLGPISATPLLGKKECTYGPSYWCENIPQSKQCNAFSHCKQTVWEQHVYPRDSDQICKICLDMVTQARDQLRSNETLEDLKAVFEGSCALIPIKMVRKECDNLVDNFIPELVEALSSEMDPTAVCSVAGLCNNKAIDKMLMDRDTMRGDEEYGTMYKNFNCKDCGTIGDILVQKFKSADPDDVLEAILQGCGHMGSFSDACSSLALVHYQRIYRVLDERLTTANICHLSGACYLKYHKHDEMDSELEVRTMGNVGLIRPAEMGAGDDVPCELCKQLVLHLRDIVIANSTEQEFKTVLRGICDELGGLKDECDGLVENYSDTIFKMVSSGLNPEMVCGVIKICDGNSNRRLIMPLLALEPQQIEMSLKLKEPAFTKSEIDALQLPFDTLMGPQNSQQLIENGEVCTLCEMVLHFVQESMAQPATEEEIKESVRKICDVLPKSVQAECENFVSTYGDAVIAMLIQEIDPSEVCPLMKMCSSKVKKDVEIFETKQMSVEIQSKDKPTCPLCLLAVTEAKARIQTDKSRQNIKHTLETLCNHLPQKLKVECTDFVDSYAQTLIDLLIKDMSPQQICVELKLCDANKDKAVPVFESVEENDLMNNEIPDNTVNGRVVVMGHITPKSSPECLVCQHLVQELEKELSDKPTREQIKRIVDHVCDKVKDNLKSKCTIFMDKHEEQIIDLVIKGVRPKEMCAALGFCASEGRDREAIEEIVEQMFNPDVDDYNKDQKSTPECLLCKEVVKELEKKLVNKHSREEIKRILDQVCHKLKILPMKKCTAFINKHEEKIIDLIINGLAPKELCEALMLCAFEGGDGEDLDIDEAFSIDFISVPAGPSSMGRIQLLNKDIEDQRQPPQVRANEGCVLCEFVMTKLEADLNKKETQDEIRQAVENICTQMPKSVRPGCTKFVDNYAELVISLLATTPPAKICQELKMCTPPSIEEQKHEEVMKEMSNDVLECAVCQGAVTVLDRLLEDPDFDRNLEKVVEKTCTVAPKLYKNKCSEMVHAYGPSMINMLLAKAQPEKVCEEISLCFPNEYSTFVQINEEVIPSRIRRQVEPLGARKCTWGPTYWCSTVATAEECNAVNHCLEKHWNGVKPEAKESE